MRNPTQLKNSLMIVAVIASMAACSAISGREIPGENVDDARITTKVKAAIFDDPSLKVLQVNVETFQNVVQLSGFVDSTQSENRAVELAGNVSGVRSVKDDIIIR